MTYIDTNMTFSPQVCDIAVGGIMGAGVFVIYLMKFMAFTLAFYLIYRVTEVLKIRRMKK